MKMKIDLKGPEGNPFALLATAKGLCRQLDLDMRTIRAEMMESDYTNLVAVFEKHFGEFVKLKNKP